MSVQTRRPNAVLSVYPITQAFKERLQSYVGADTQWLTLGELRQMSLPAMLIHLRTLRFLAIYLPLEEGEGSALLPALQILASVVPARRRFVIDQSLKVKQFGRVAQIVSAWKIVYASARALAAKISASERVERLALPERNSAPRTPGLNVFFLNANLWFGVKAGGSVGHISGVANGFMKLGYPVTYAAVGGRLLVSPDATYVQLRSPDNFGVPIEYNYYYFNNDVIDQVSSLDNFKDASFIYQRMSVCNFAGAELSRRSGKPLVLEYNGSEAWVSKNWGRPLRSQHLAEKCEDVSLKSAQLIVTISDVLRDELLSRGIPPERIVCYPNCIDPEIFNPDRFGPAQAIALRAKHGISPQATVVTFIGTFGQWHGAPVLAQAAHTLLEQRSEWVRNNELHFVFVGDGVRMPEVRSALGRHIDSSHVTVAGLVPQDQAPLYLAASDILSSPHVPNADGSRFFGSPTKLFEYMAMGKAILASDLDQIGSVLKDSIHVSSLPKAGTKPSSIPPALLAKPGSVDDIVLGLTFLAEHPEWRSALGHNARQLALKKYTWEHHVGLIVSRMKELGLST